MKKLLHQLLLVFLMAVCYQGVSAQEKKMVSGTVKDSDGVPVIAANILEKGTSNGVVSDEKGAFKISVAPNAVLLISSVGLKPQEVKTDNSGVVNVQLQTATNELEGIVVTALGIKRQNKTLGYSVSKIDGAQLARTNTINPIAALQGKVAGVNINLTGAAGVQSSPSIIIRGATSLSRNNQPIFVIDGNVLENNVQDADGVDSGSQLKNLNPDDYESITVLKGAAATSIYGSRGANGAIIITTKRGKLSTGLGVEYNFTSQIQNIYQNGLALQDVYGSGSAYFREGNFDAAGNQVKTSYSFGPRMDGSLHPAIHDNTKMVPYSPQPNNWKTFYQDGFYKNHNIAITGGSEKITYRFSYSNMKNDGVLPNNAVNRNNFDFRTTGQINKTFSTEVGVSYAMTDAKNFYGQGRYYWDTGQNLGFLTYYSVPRNTDLADWKANYRNADGSMKSYGYGQWDNVINGAFNRFDNRNNTNHERSLLANFLLKAQLLPWVDVSAKASINNYKTQYENKEYGGGAFGSGGYFGVGGNYSSSYNYLFTAHANKKAMNGDLDIDFRILNEYYGDGKSESYGSSTRGGLTVPGLFTLSNSVENIKDNTNYGYRRPTNKTIGLAGILNLGYKDFLDLELTGRNDWLSTLTYPKAVTAGENNYTVFYPSANLSWIFSNQFKENMPSWMSFGKLRASVARVGKGTGAYQTGFGTYWQSPIIDANGNSVTVAGQNDAGVLPNLDLKPEIQQSIEFGTNLSFFKNFVDLDVSVYKTNMFNQIMTIGGAIETGYTQRRINAGNIQNKGIEVELNFHPIAKKDIKLDLGFIYSSNRGKIIKFDGVTKDFTLMGGYNGVEVHAYEGGEFGVMIPTAGWASYAYDEKTGLPLLQVGDKYVGNGASFQEYSWSSPTDDVARKSKLGNVQPKFLGGFNSTFRYKNLSLFVQLDTRVGGVAYSEAYNYGMQRGNLLNSLKYRDQEHGGVKRVDSYTGKEVYDGAIPDAIFDKDQVSPITGVSIAGMTFKDAYAKGLVEPWKAGSYYLNSFGWGTNVQGATSEVSWVMFREVSLSCNIPNQYLKKLNINSARIGLTGRNLGYLYNNLVGGQNPESLQSNDPFKPVITGGVPFSRNFSFSLNLTF